jgi:hypothetical protein
MNISALVSVVPDGFNIFLILLVAVIIYALRTKGDVRAEFSHGETRFKLEAKDRPTRSSRGVRDRGGQ